QPDRVAGRRRGDRTGGQWRPDPARVGPGIAGQEQHRRYEGTLRVEYGWGRAAAGTGPLLNGDPILLEWALESLVKNSIDAMKGRSGSITVEVGQDDRSGTIRVIDDGPGISTDIMSTLFEPGITTKTGGWGIGLALARRVVEDSHGGELILENPPSGASFL